MKILMDVCSLLAKLLGLYSAVICIRFVLSWFPGPSQYNQYGQRINAERPFYDILVKITEPFLRIFRSPKLVAGGRLDFSGLFALMVLNILRTVCTVVGQIGYITIGAVAVIIIRSLWSYLFSYILVLLVIVLVLRYIAGRKPFSPQWSAFVRQIDPVLYNPVNLVHRVFYRNKPVSDQKLILTALIFYAVIYFGIRYGLTWLESLVAVSVR